MTDKGFYTILVKAVTLVRDDPTYGPRLSNCWLPAATWVEALQKTGHIDASLSIDVRKFNTAMSRAPLFGSVMTRFDGSNNSGVFRVSFQHQHFYFFTQETRQVKYPSPLNQAWKEMVMGYAANVRHIPSTRARPAGIGDSTPILPTPVSGGSESFDAKEGESAGVESPPKRQRTGTGVGAVHRFQLLAV
jgi:hypothetical protein